MNTSLCKTWGSYYPAWSKEHLTVCKKNITWSMSQIFYNSRTLFQGLNLESQIFSVSFGPQCFACSSWCLVMLRSIWHWYQHFNSFELSFKWKKTSEFDAALELSLKSISLLAVLLYKCTCDPSFSVLLCPAARHPAARPTLHLSKLAVFLCQPLW